MVRIVCRFPNCWSEIYTRGVSKLVLRRHDNEAGGRCRTLALGRATWYAFRSESISNAGACFLSMEVECLWHEKNSREVNAFIVVES